MEDFFTRVSENLIGRVHGPMNARIFIQASVAALLAIRAGLRDAREGRPPFFWALAFNPDHRRELLRQGWKDIAKVFIAALVLDVIYQLKVVGMVYPGEAIVVAFLLAVVPYLLLRAPVTRLFSKKKSGT